MLIFYFSYLRLRGTPDVKDEMDDMRVEHEAIKSLPHVSFKDMIVNPALRSPLIIGKKHTLENMTSLFAATFEEVLLLAILQILPKICNFTNFL